MEIREVSLLLLLRSGPERQSCSCRPTRSSRSCTSMVFRRRGGANGSAKGAQGNRKTLSQAQEYFPLA